MKIIFKLLLALSLTSCVTYTELIDDGLEDWDFTLPCKAVYSSQVNAVHDIKYIEVKPVVNRSNCRALIYDYEIDTNEVYSFGLIEDYLSEDKKHVHYKVIYHLKDGNSFELYNTMIDIKKLIYYPEYTDMYMYGY